MMNSIVGTPLYMVSANKVGVAGLATPTSIYFYGIGPALILYSHVLGALSHAFSSTLSFTPKHSFCVCKKKKQKTKLMGEANP